MKKRKIKLNFKRIFLLIILVLLIASSIYFFMSNKNDINATTHQVSNFSDKVPDYPVIKLDNNPNYSGIRSNSSKWKRWIYHNFYD